MAQPLASAAQFEYDDETAALILKLQLEDIDEILDSTRSKGKGKQGEISDAEAAFQLEKKELERNAMVLLDRQMTKSIARAVLWDGDAIAHSEALERQAEFDRIVAENLAASEGAHVARRSIISRPAPSVISESVDDELMDKFSAIYVDTPHEENRSTALVKRVDVEIPDENGESSTWAATRKYHRRQCVICEENHAFYDVARLTCGHQCCRTCLMEMFQAATIDESRFPPKCCEEISPEPENVRLFLSAEMIEKYLEKKIEWETKNRTYCSNLQCGKFIRHEHVLADQAFCPVCHAVTCTLCKKAGHELDCPEDEDLRRTLELSLGQGWRRCQNCHRVIDLKIGCNHITCHCKAQFCYVCGAEWRTCQCPLWDENRLYSQAHEVAGRQPGGVGNAVARLQEQAQCAHLRFERQAEAGRCEDCAEYMYRFIFECQNCPLRLCLRCRRERL